MTIFTCEDHFDAMMTCVYEAWASRLGHSNIKLKTEPIGNLELFCDYRHVDADPEKTGSVVRSIKSKISYQAYIMIYEAAMSDAEDKLDTIYRFMVAGFHYGAHVVDFLQEPVVMRMFELKRKVGNEAHQRKGFANSAAENRPAPEKRVWSKATGIPRNLWRFASFLQEISEYET